MGIWESKIARKGLIWHRKEPGEVCENLEKGILPEMGSDLTWQ